MTALGLIVVLLLLPVCAGLVAADLAGLAPRLSMWLARTALRWVPANSRHFYGWESDIHERLDSRGAGYQSRIVTLSKAVALVLVSGPRVAVRERMSWRSAARAVGAAACLMVMVNAGSHAWDAAKDLPQSIETMAAARTTYAEADHFDSLAELGDLTHRTLRSQAEFLLAVQGKPAPDWSGLTEYTALKADLKHGTDEMRSSAAAMDRLSKKGLVLDVEVLLMGVFLIAICWRALRVLLFGSRAWEDLPVGTWLLGLAIPIVRAALVHKYDVRMGAFVWADINSAIVMPTATLAFHIHARLDRRRRQLEALETELIRQLRAAA